MLLENKLKRRNCDIPVVSLRQLKQTFLWCHSDNLNKQCITFYDKNSKWMVVYSCSKADFTLFSLKSSNCIYSQQKNHKLHTKNSKLVFCKYELNLWLLLLFLYAVWLFRRKSGEIDIRTRNEQPSSLNFCLKIVCMV